MELIWQHWMFISINHMGVTCKNRFSLIHVWCFCNDTNYLPQLYQNGLKHKVTTNSAPWLWDKCEHFNFFHNDIVCPVSFFLLVICLLLSVFYGLIYGFWLPLSYLKTFISERHILHKLSTPFYINKSLRSVKLKATFYTD